jgi:hypothetical protein
VETRPELWLADYRLACQLGGTDDDNLIIYNLPLFLSDAARAWLEHLPPAQIFGWDNLVKAFAGNFQGTYMRPRNSWDLRSCRQQSGESLREYIRRFSKQRTKLPNITDSDVIGAFLAGTTCRDLVSKLGRKTATKASELMDIATKFASGQEAVKAIFRKDKQPQGRQKEDVPEASVQHGTKKKTRKKAQAKRDAVDVDLVTTVEHRNPQKPPGGANMFDKMLKELCPYHRGPVKHTLEECDMLRRYFNKAGPSTEGGKDQGNNKKGRQGRGVPGGPQLLHDLRRASGECFGSTPQAGASGGLLGEGSSADLPRLVRQAHHLRPRQPPRLRTETRKVPACHRPCHRQR